MGRNGAGKSAILEGFANISSYAIGQRQKDNESNLPKVLNIEVLTPTRRYLEYSYELAPLADFLDEDVGEVSEEGLFSWNDRCQYLDGEKETIWKTETGETTFKIGTGLSDSNRECTFISGGDSLLAGASRLKISETIKGAGLKLPQEIEWVSSVLWQVRLLGNELIRLDYRRQPSLLKVKNGRVPSVNLGLADSLNRMLFRYKESAEIDEIEKVCQRVGIANKVSIPKYELSDGASRSSDREAYLSTEEYFTEVLLDGVNIGLLSDGTLKVLSILTEIVTAPPGRTTLIEEPETQIHPGMLAKLLNEIETYTYGENLIISTHSPQVVAASSPDKINFIHRENGQTFVRKLHDAEIQQVYEYLNEEGDLGEWIYSGMLDD